MAAIDTNPNLGQNQVSYPSPQAPKDFPKALLLIPFILVFILLIYLAFKLLSPKISKTSGGEITWWGLWEDKNVITPVIEEYQQKNPKVKINYVFQSKEDYRERLTSALASGKGPDIFRFHNTWVPMFKNDLDKMPASVYSPSDFSQIFYPVAVADLTIGSAVLGIPLEYDGLGLFINSEIFERGAKNTPSSWDELRKTALALTVKDERGNIQQAGVALGKTENVDHWPEILGLMMLQNGVKLTNPTGKLAEDALTYFTIFSGIDRVWDATLPNSTSAFAGGKLAMYFGPSWRVHEIKAISPKLKFVVVPVPQLPKEDKIQTNNTYASYWVEGVWNKSKSKEEAWKFLKFLSSKETLTKLYTNASKQRLFGEPYPRSDMASLLRDDPFVGAFISQAPSAQSWFLASKTWDGPTGINSQLNAYFGDAVNAINSGSKATELMSTVAKGVNQVLSAYGLVKSTTISK